MPGFERKRILTLMRVNWSYYCSSRKHQSSSPSPPSPSSSSSSSTLSSLPSYHYQSSSIIIFIITIINHRHRNGRWDVERMKWGFQKNDVLRIWAVFRKAGALSYFWNVNLGVWWIFEASFAARSPPSNSFSLFSFTHWAITGRVDDFLRSNNNFKSLLLVS